jgi:endonuclease/exonuclease/phosphatase family metal-dependent hydrolase
MNKAKYIGAACALGVILTAGACRKAELPGNDAELAVTIMTFNVENLFDNFDDPGKDDRTYLSLADKQTDEHRAACATIEVRHWREQCEDWDWNDEVIDRKLRAVANTILQVGNGKGADIVALQEVENLGILERLRTDYLGDAGYLPAVLVEGNDLRGIDVAFLSKLPLYGAPQLHGIPFDGVDSARVADTRGILQADFQLPDGNILSGFSVHFPAPFHPTEMREIAYGFLNGLLEALPADRPAFAAGDFNTTSSEDARENLLGNFVRPQWTVAHETGCGDCRGTQYYAPDDSWSFLDMILWARANNRGENTTWHIRADSVEVANKLPAQVTPEGTPNRFSFAEGDGVSDHWPLVMTIESKQKQ